MKTLNFSKRNLKELLRDPTTVIFTLILPVALLFLMSIINKNVPIPVFAIERLTPGIAFFGLSFVGLFAAINVSADRETAFISRLFSTTMKPANYILGYTCPLVLIGTLQAMICFAVSIIFGMKFSFSMIFALIICAVCSLLFISIGICLGCVLTNKASSGISSIIIQLAAWLSGIWFDVELVGKVYKKICEFLPFYHGVEIIKATLNLDCQDFFAHFVWIIGYTVILFALAIFLFRKKMT